jgi:hypothetical protein
MSKKRSIIKEEDDFTYITHEQSEKSVTVNYGGIEYMHGSRNRPSNEESSYNQEEINPIKRTSSFFNNFNQALGGFTMNENYIDEAISSKSKSSKNISSQGKKDVSD